MNSRRWCLGLSFVALAIVCPAQNKADAVKKAVEDYIAANKVVGISVTVLKANGDTFSAGYGWQDRESKIPATANTRYRLGSISKPVTSVAVMQLVEAGKTSLTDDVRKLVPEWPEKPSPINLQNLLTHTSGIRHYAFGKIDKHYESITPLKALDFFRDDALLFTPGEKFSYSTHAFTLVARVVEAASGEEFGAYVKKHVSGPAGASSLQLEDRNDGSKDRSQLYEKGETTELVAADKVEDISWKCGGGGMESNAPDLARFGIALLTDKLMKPATKELMFSDQHVPGLNGKRGLGWALSLTGNPNHGGAQQGCRTMMLLDLKSRTVFVVLSNTGGDHPLGTLLASIRAIWAAAGND